MADLPPELSGCAECGAGYGEAHWPGCGARKPHQPGYEPGMRDAVLVCRERGWAVVHVPGEGWRPCDPSEPGSYIDVDRYRYWLEHEAGELVGNDSQP